jgi:5-methylcytosine-specific restriction endonuclease McrA
MGYDLEMREYIYDKTGGYCHICDGKIHLSKYANLYHRQGWEVDHSVPISLGGTDHPNNLWPAHVDCNRRKGARSTRSARRPYLIEDSSLLVDTLKTAAILGVIGFFVVQIFGNNSSENPNNIQS